MSIKPQFRIEFYDFGNMCVCNKDLLNLNAFYLVNICIYHLIFAADITECMSERSKLYLFLK